MSVLSNGSALSAVLWLLVKSSVLLAAVGVVYAITRRKTSAAGRHLALTAVAAALLLLPLLSGVLPSWEVALRLATPPTVPLATVERLDPIAAASGTTALSPGTPEPAAFASMPPRTGISRVTALLALYLAGAAVLLLYIATEWLMVRRLAREAADVADPQWRRLFLDCARTLGIVRPVRLLRSRERSMPMAFGTRAPAIMLPSVADTWSDERRRAVLLHELAHVSRQDCLTQTLAAIACAVYWVHPGVWWLARRLRIERELACDDRVLTTGTHAREYAGHLLELAHTLGGGRAPALMVSMARPQQLEGRMLAVMDGGRNRAVPGFRSRLAGLTVAAALIVPLATVQAAIVNVGYEGAVALPAVPEPAEPPIAADSGSETGPDRTARSTPAVARMPAAAIADAQSSGRGTWEIRPAATSGMVHLRLTEGDSSSGFSIRVDALEGLSTAQLSGAGGAVRFSLRRDAGTFSFEGTARDGVGAGTYSFAPSPTFGAELQKRGFDRPTADEQYALARADTGFAFLDELTAQGYARPVLSLLIRAGQHGVRVDYLREMAAAGYRLGSLDPLITLRDHGVTPEFARQLAAAGFKGLSADDLRRTRDHGVTPEFVREFRDLGYSAVTLEELVNARDHGVTPQFVRDLGALGKGKLQLAEVVRLRDHGVSSEYVRDMRALDQNLTIEQVVRSRDHGVSVEFASEVAALGYQKQPIDSLIRLRDHGVTASYIRELKELGYTRLDLDELVGLRDHGVTPDRIRRANERAGTRLPLDMIKALANGGMK